MTSLVSPTAVMPAARLRGRIEVPSDKSIGHRALIVNALSGGPATVRLRSPGADLLSTVGALRALGVRIDEERQGSVVSLALSGTLDRDATIDCGNSGTTMRLLAGAVAGRPLRVTLDGDASLRARPMERAATLLRAAGAEVTTADGAAPMTIHGRSVLRAVAHELPVASAQLIGAAALAGLSAKGTTLIESPGPTRDHTERLLAAAGVPIRREGRTTILDGPATPRPTSTVVPGDISSAAPWIVAAALHPEADVTIAGVGLNPTRTALLDVLRRMGADIETASTDLVGPEPIGDIRVRGGSRLRATSIGPEEVPALIDELPLLSVAMAAADGTSEVRGANELRVKESDRIAAVANGLGAMGASVSEQPDGWRIGPGSRTEARITTHGDHRIAIAFAVAALAGVASAVDLDDPGCVAISYPTFWDDLAAVTA